MDAAGCSQEVDTTAGDSSIGGNKPTFLRQRRRSYATESVEWRYRIGHLRKWVWAAIGCGIGQQKRKEDATQITEPFLPGAKTRSIEPMKS